MFQGQFVHAVDAKGRTSLPSRFREALEARGDRTLMLTTALEPCVAAYGRVEWALQEAKVAGKSDDDEDAEPLTLPDAV